MVYDWQRSNMPDNTFGPAKLRLAGPKLFARAAC